MYGLELTKQVFYFAEDLYLCTHTLQNKQIQSHDW